MNSIMVAYSSRTGKTRRVAEIIARELGVLTDQPVAVRDLRPESFGLHALNVLGTPTYGMGDLDFRWVKFFAAADPKLIMGRRFALFALGDQKFHGATFAGSIWHFARAITRAGGLVVGRWPCQDYSFAHAPALEDDGFFPGLVVDEVSQAHLTEQRVQQWVQALRHDPSCRGLFSR